MGIREHGYRHWEGQYRGHGFRWWSIAKQVVRSTISTKGRLTFLLIFAAVIWVPFLMVGITAYFTGATAYVFDCGNDFRGSGPRTAVDADSVVRCALYDLFRGWQFLVLPPFVALVATPAVSNDLRSNALFIYLSKPLGRLDYLLGKTVGVMIWLVPITFLPPMFMWFMVNATSSELPTSQLSEPGAILVQILLFQLVVVALFTVLPLAFAGFTKRWWIGAMAFLSAYYVPWFMGALLRDLTRKADWSLVSIVDNLVNVAQAVFDVRSTAPAAAPSFIIVLLLLAGSAAMFTWRVLKVEVAE